MPKSMKRSSVANNVWYKSMLVGNVPSAYERISTTLISSDTTLVTFSSVPQTYKHLELRYTVRGNQATVQSTVRVRFNGNTGGSSYSYHNLTGDGSTAFANNNVTDRINLSIAAGNGMSTEIFGAGIASILDYSSTVKNTTTRSIGGVRPNDSGWNASIYSGVFLNTAAITTIELALVDGAFKEGTRFSLYGIRG
jgi:hypothetical protein